MGGGGGYVVKTYPSIDPIAASRSISVSLILRERIYDVTLATAIFRLRVWLLHEQGSP